MSEKPIIWSYGGGVQSVAILVLISQGRLPKPERVVMADTGRERSTTWEYTERYAVPLMRQCGMVLEVVTHSYATVDLYTRKGRLLIPAFTQSGKLPTFCSHKWKKEPVLRYLREQGYGPKRPVVEWLGMSLDEIQRMRVSELKWIQFDYPLVFSERLRRHECAAMIESAGLPVPPKSACWMCPNMNNAEWLEVKEKSPDDFWRAVEMDATIRANDQRGGLWLHGSKLQLDQVDFAQAKPTPMEEYCTQYCWV